MEKPDILDPMQQVINLENGNTDLQDMLADALAEVALLREKHLLDHKAIQLLQRKACMLASAADMGAAKCQDETNTLERKLQGQLMERECQVMAAVAEAEQWRRRGGLLQLQLSSAQEDIDLISRRCHLLQEESAAQSRRADIAQARLDAAASLLEDLEQRLHIQEQQEAVLKGTLAQVQLQQSSTEAEMMAAAQGHAQAREEWDRAAQRTHAQLADAQAEAERLGGQVRQAQAEAAAAQQRAADLEWRLQRQKQSLAERAHMASEAKQVTDVLSEEGLKAVREKAGFLEAELRGQLADARAFLADERQMRRTAEAALATSEAALRRSLDSAQAETAALRHQVQLRDARIAALEDTLCQQQAKAAMDVVHSLVSDLDPHAAHQGERSPAALPLATASDSVPAPAANPAVAAPVSSASQRGMGGTTEDSGEQDGTRRATASCMGGQQGRHAPRCDSAAAASKDAEVPQKVAPTLPAAPAKGGKQGGKKRAAADSAQQPAKKRKPAEAAEQLGQPGVGGVRAEQEPSADGTQAPLPEGGGEPEVAVPAHPGGRVMRARVSKGVWWAGTTGPPGPQAAHSALGSDIDIAEAPGPVMAAGVAEQPEARAGQRLNKDKSRAEAPKEETGCAVGTVTILPKPAQPAAAKEGRRRAAHAPAHQEMGSGMEQEGAGKEETAVQGVRPLSPRIRSRHVVQDTGAGRAGHLQPPEGQLEEQPAASEALEEAAGTVSGGHDGEFGGSEQETGQPVQSQVVAEGAAEVAMMPADSRDKGRPSGVSKIDLTAVWGRVGGPAIAGGSSGSSTTKDKDKENAAAATTAAAPLVHRPAARVPASGSQSAANPLAALHPGVLAAALKARGPDVPGLGAMGKAHSRLPQGSQGAPGKRKLLPAPKPLKEVAALPHSMLFGHNFQIPKLNRH